MSRQKYSVEEKIKAVERYLRGEASAGEIAAEMKMSKRGCAMVVEWAAMYRENGTEGFHLTRGNLWSRSLVCSTAGQTAKTVQISRCKFARSCAPP